MIVLLSGTLLSFLGQLPLGTMSITATQIAIQENFRSAWKYSIGVAFVEIIYLRLVLSGMEFFKHYSFIWGALGWITVAIFLILGILCLFRACKADENKKALLLQGRLNRFLLGIIMSALNPAQIPFWFVWSGYFMDIHWLASDSNEFNWFTAGAGIRTLAGLAVYKYGGNWLVAKMKTSHRTLNQIMGIIFIIAALGQLYHILFKYNRVT
ncbi:MAG: LysE family translocator [Chitinophagales bacterium]